jgi:hypothetical protein
MVFPGQVAFGSRSLHEAMTSPCDVYDEWFDEESEDLLDELGDLINQALEGWGFDPVDVVAGDLSAEGVAGQYENGVITLDQEHEAFGDPDDALSVAYHEAIHAAIEQAGLQFDGVEEELIAAFAGAAAGQGALEGCASTDPAADSVVNDNYVPPYPFVSRP